jgi:hypothetical protein
MRATFPSRELSCILQAIDAAQETGHEGKTAEIFLNRAETIDGKQVAEKLNRRLFIASLQH